MMIITISLIILSTGILIKLVSKSNCTTKDYVRNDDTLEETYYKTSILLS
jgi:hypothetical protein